MKRICTQILAGILSFSLVFGTYGTCIYQDAQVFGLLPVMAAENTEAASPEKVDKTISDIINGFSNILKSDEKSALQSALGKMSGTASITNGAIVILQMAGVLKDPTAAKLEAIQNQLNIVMAQVGEINKQIKDVQQTLHSMQSQSLLDTRYNRADAAMSRWEINCLQDHLNKLEDQKAVYKLKVYNMVNSWTTSSTKNDLSAYFSDDQEELYVRKGTSIDGKTIASTYTLPESVVEQYIPSETLKQDSYTQDLISQLTNAIMDAAQKGLDNREKEELEKEQKELDTKAKQYKNNNDKPYEEVISQYTNLSNDMTDINNQINELLNQKSDLTTQYEAKKEEYEAEEDEDKKTSLKAEINDLQSQIDQLDSKEEAFNTEMAEKNSEKDSLQSAYDQACELKDEQKSINDKLLSENNNNAKEELKADESFYEEWKTLSDQDKTNKACTIATAMVNNLVFNKSCEAMSCADGRQFILEYKNAYKEACNAVLNTEKIGMKNFWSVLTNTYAFEGQATEVFNNTMDFLIRSLGLCGSFIVSMDEQDDSQSQNMIQSDIDNWTNTVTKLQEFKDSKLTGHKNYCYLTNSVLEYKTVTLSQNVTFKTHEYDNMQEVFAYDNMSATDMTETVSDGKSLKDKSSVSDDILGALSILSQQNPEQYLKDNGVINGNVQFIKDIAFQIDEPTDFNLNEKVSSTCYLAGAGCTGNWFKNGEAYEYLDHRNDDGWLIHKKVNGSTVDLTNNNVDKNKMLANFAVFANHHWYWTKDEAALFTNMNAYRYYDKKWQDGHKLYCIETIKCSKTYGYIESVKL